MFEKILLCPRQIVNLTHSSQMTLCFLFSSLFPFCSIEVIVHAFFRFILFLWCVYRFKHVHFHFNSLFYGHETEKYINQILYTSIDNFDLIWFSFATGWFAFICWSNFLFGRLVLSFHVFFSMVLFVYSPTEQTTTTNESFMFLFFISVEFEFGIYIHMNILFILQIEYALLLKRMFKGILMATHISVKSFYRKWQFDNVLRRTQSIDTFFENVECHTKYTNTLCSHTHKKTRGDLRISKQAEIDSATFVCIYHKYVSQFVHNLRLFECWIVATFNSAQYEWQPLKSVHVL